MAINSNNSRINIFHKSIVIKYKFEEINILINQIYAENIKNN